MSRAASSSKEILRSLVLELRPTMLESAGLEPTVTWIAKQHAQRTGLAIEVEDAV
jgi:signal transduction histidine kinase